MNIDIAVRRSAEHQDAFGELLRQGLKRHGIACRVVGISEPTPAPVVACWGWRNGQRYRAMGKTVLIMERGYMADRFHWTSLGWNGLNGRAIWPAVDDGGARFDRLFASLLQPWRAISTSGLAVIMGQVSGDASLIGINIRNWYSEAAIALRDRGFEARFRPHPLAREPLPEIPPILNDLDVTLDKAAVVVTMNSNSGVDAVLAGCPTIACDIGSMALPVAAFGLDAPLTTPDRSVWAARMAWRQWSPGELAQGEFVEPVMAAMPR